MNNSKSFTINNKFTISLSYNGDIWKSSVTDSTNNINIGGGMGLNQDKLISMQEAIEAAERCIISYLGIQRFKK